MHSWSTQSVLLVRLESGPPMTITAACSHSRRLRIYNVEREQVLELCMDNNANACIEFQNVVAKVKGVVVEVVLARNNTGSVHTLAQTNVTN